jgi:hypothetical protein
VPERRVMTVAEPVDEREVAELGFGVVVGADRRRP